MTDGAPGIFCALDTADLAQALRMAQVAATAGLGLKLGLEFFNAQGPQGVRAVIAAQPAVPLFLDLKFHDIPNTVAQAVRAVVPLGAAYINVHAAGGLAMMRAAQDAAQDEAAKRGVAAPKILAVTVLTSLAAGDLRQTGVEYDVETQVQGLTELALQAGLSGIVCSAHEIEAMRNVFGSSLVLMVPGIRPAGHVAGSDDQSRVMTPREAVDAGATHLVIGRPITAAADPAAAAASLAASLRA